MSRARWAPENDEQKKLLAGLRRIIKREAARQAAADAEVRDMLAKCEAAGIPIARIAEEMGTQRKTVYRRLGRPMP